jgi:hypothetical protein
MDDSIDARRLSAPQWMAICLLVAAVGVFHARWIYAHFSNDGYLCDSGWLAFLFEQADPRLLNPKAIVGRACEGVNAPTFLAHHLSPHLFLFGAPLAALGLSGIDILAYHQGMFFGIVVAATALTAAASRVRGRDRWLALLAALPIGVVGNAVLQAAAYPHYETAMTGLSALAIAAWSAGLRRLFTCCLIWLPLIREDGGLFVALVSLACLAIDRGEPERDGADRRRLGAAAVVGLMLSAVAFLVKAHAFPGFDAFANNFSGDDWRHVTGGFIRERARATLTNWNIAPVMIGSLVLAFFDLRYVTGMVLLAPLLLIHMLSIRPEHGSFSLYYALPFVLAVVIWLAVLVRRLGAGTAGAVEKGMLLVLTLMLTAPVQALAGAPQHRWIVVEQGFSRPVVNLAAMKELARWVLTNYASEAASRNQRQCASMGIAALIPDDLTADAVVDPATDLTRCRTLILLRSDMHHAALVARAEAAGFKRVGERAHAEVWMR